LFRESDETFDFFGKWGLCAIDQEKEKKREIVVKIMYVDYYIVAARKNLC